MLNFLKIKNYEFLLETGKINGLVEPLNYMEPDGIFEKKNHSKGDWTS